MATTGWISAGTVVDDNGNHAWTDIANARLLDGSFAISVSGPYQARLAFSGWDFASAAIPLAAIIKGLEVRYRSSHNSNSGAARVDVYAYRGATFLGSKFGTPGGDALRTNGGPADLWGAALSASDFQSGSNFKIGLAMEPYMDGNPEGNTASHSVDGLELRVTYDLPTLNALTLGASTVNHNAKAGSSLGTLTGVTAGSTLSLINSDGGNFSLNGSTIQVSDSLSELIGTTRSITVRETLSGATNSPRETTFSITVVRGFAGPTYHSAGAQIAGSGNVTPQFPAGWQPNDILITLVETSSDAVTINAPAGWSEFPNSPQTNGASGGTTSVRLNAFWRRAVAGDTAQAITASAATNHRLAQTFTIRGCSPSGNPFDVLDGGTSTGTALSTPSITTTLDDTLVVVMAASSIDSAAARFSNWTNASLGNGVERVDSGTTSGNGGGLAFWTGEKIVAGTVNSTTATVTSGGLAYLTVAFKAGASVEVVNATANPSKATLTLSPKAPVTSATTVIAQTITSPSTLNVGSYSGNYEVARAGAGLTTGIYGWVGQYFTGSSYEISQVFLGFDLSAVPNREITKAELRFTVNEAYGVNTVEARLHDWQDASSFVAGADLASKPLLGSTSVSAGQTGAKVISLTGVTRSSLLKIVLAGADQRTGTPPVGDDTTLLLSAGASLYLEFGDEIPSVNVLASPVAANIEITRSAPNASFTAAYVSTPSSTSLALQGGLGSAGASILSAPTAAILSLGSKGVSINSAALAGALRGNLSIVGYGPSVQSDTVAAPSANPLTIAPSSATTSSSSISAPATAGLSIAGQTPTTLAQRNLTSVPLTASALLTGQIAQVRSGAAASPVVGALAITGFRPVVSSSTADEALSLAGQIVLEGKAVVAQSSASASAHKESVSITGLSVQANATTNIAAAPLARSLDLTGRQVTASTSSNVSASPQTGSLTLTAGQALSSATRSFTAWVQQTALSITGRKPSVSATTNVTAVPHAEILVVSGQPIAAKAWVQVDTLPGLLELSGLQVEAIATESPFLPLVADPERTIIGTHETRVIEGVLEHRGLAAMAEDRSVVATPEMRFLRASHEARTINSQTEERLLVATP